jgi:hypothetical protein
MATRPPTAPVRTAATDTHAYVDWGAVIAGAVIAAAISLVLLTFGSAIGLSMASPYEGAGASKALFAIALGLWVVWVIVSSNLAGGYVVGRMRRRIGDATEHESDVRDGTHGIAMWGLGVLIAAVLAMAGVSGVVAGGAKLASAAGGSDATAYTVDSLFRATGQQPAGGAETFAAKREATRILAQGTAGRPIADADKAYLGRLVAARTGLSQAEAEQRVTDVLAKAKAAADAARKTGIVAGFVIAAALLAAAAAAWWAAVTGGRHRDQGTDFSHFTRWR